MHARQQDAFPFSSGDQRDQPPLGGSTGMTSGPGMQFMMPEPNSHNAQKITELGFNYFSSFKGQKGIKKFILS